MKQDGTGLGFKAGKEWQGESTSGEMYFDVNFYMPIPCNWTSWKMLINIRGRETQLKKKVKLQTYFFKILEITLRLYMQGVEHTQI